MKKLITTIIVSLAFLFVTAAPVAAKKGNRVYDNRHHDNGYHRGWHHSYNYKHHYRHGKEYRYKGHHGSWEQWERYKRHHPGIERRGHYYHEGGHLMFGFSDESGNSFFFSIGR